MPEKSDHMNFKHARTEEQLAKMKQIYTEGVCPFCEPHLARFHDAPIERQTDHWSLTKNDYPYSGTVVHYVAIYRSHITDISDMPAEAFADLGQLLQETARSNGLQGGAFVMRFGDTDRTGATIDHLHAHLITGGSREEGTEKLRIPIGYKKK